MTQDNSAGLASRSEDIAASATFITEPSMNARLEPKIVAMSVARGWRLGQGVALAPSAASQGLKTAAILPRTFRISSPFGTLHHRRDGPTKAWTGKMLLKRWIADNIRRRGNCLGNA